MGVNAIRYDGKRVLVAGGASGMGRAVAELVTGLGGEVVVADVAPVTFPVAASAALDLRDKASIDAAVDEMGGPFHSVFSCAGVAGEPFSPIELMLVNFVGQRHLVERLLESAIPDEGSSIAFISSVGGLGWEKNLPQVTDLLATPDYESAQRWCEKNVPTGDNYGLSKQAVDVYVQLRAFDLSQRGIRINATAPGPTMTPLMASTPSWQQYNEHVFKAQMHRDGSTAEEQAWPLVFLNSDAASFVSGVALNVDLGFTAAGYMGMVQNPMVESLIERVPN